MRDFYDLEQIRTFDCNNCSFQACIPLDGFQGNLGGVQMFHSLINQKWTFGKVMEFTLRPQREFLFTWKHISWEAPAVHDLALLSPTLLFPTVKHTFLLHDLAPLLSIFSLFPLVLKQPVYCACSAEQPALKAACMCVCPSQLVRLC